MDALGLAEQCKVAGCLGDANHSARGRNGFCNKHYLRYQRHGDPLGGSDYRSSHTDRIAFIEAAVNNPAEDGCIEWPFGASGNGYAQIQISLRYFLVHRLVCEKAHGRAPSITHEAAHVCGNRRCVNPNHLRWATPQENQADRIIHGTACRGEDHPGAKITNEQAQQIFSLKGAATQQQIADAFGISRAQVSAIHRLENWCSVVETEDA